MKTIITLAVIVLITVKVIFAAVDNIAPQVEQNNERTEQVVAQALK